MTLQLLYDGKFEDYFAQAREGSPLWLMVHVPKTAGSSLVSELAGLLQPSYNINVLKGDPALKHAERFEAAVSGFLESAQTIRYRYVTGHLTGDHAERIRAALPDVRAFAMLRHPVARFVSDYRYQRTPMHSDSERFKATYPDFPTYVHKHRITNKITSHLVPKRILDTKDVRACIDYIGEHFSFIGLQEAYPLSFRTITAMIGSPARPTAKVRVNTQSAESSVVMTPEFERIIRANNPIDMAVYQEFAKRFRGMREGLVAYFKGAAR